MIEHADAALAAWFATLDPPLDVTFDRADGEGGATRPSDDKRTRVRPTLQLSLSNIREQHDKRDNQVDEIRKDGRVVGRQKRTRFFELDYVCSVIGPANTAHRCLGGLLRLLVDHDVVPNEFVPDDLSGLGHPLDVQLVASPVPGAALTIRVVLPVRPTVATDIGPPTESLHLDMAPPPGPPASATGSSSDLPPIGERRWTTVRRRELIGAQESVSERHDTTGLGGRAS